MSVSRCGWLVVDDLGRVAAVVEHHVRASSRPGPRRVCSMHHSYSSSVSPFQAKTGMPRAAIADGGMVLGREDVARAPAHRGAEIHQRLDQHRGLDRHVQAADDARAGQRLRRAELVAQRHQPRHLGLGDRDLAPAPIGERDIGDLVVGEFGHSGSPATSWPVTRPYGDIYRYLYIVQSTRRQNICGISMSSNRCAASKVARRRNGAL